MGDVNHEPTMEEILASIKKIIAEDGDSAASEADVRSRRKKPVLETSEPPVSDDVLELTDTVEAESAEPVAIDEDAEPIASDETIDASHAALAALTAIAQPRAEGSDAEDAHPLEGLVREMLRPMLKEWLDENLPGLVEEMVAREIARIAAGRE
ncbi:DUF2497 domain-containing protein [Parasphingopyxis sp.]|uniref:DUF2497 domain-containing protein n=1 Tax=Parasphingopyxis sp. TaxID=1920299 RepID=UPI00260F1AB3|nr:DUF2497 domain-containing protein [Parasphingopyxis sp.]